VDRALPATSSSEIKSSILYFFTGKGPVKSPIALNKGATSFLINVAAAGLLA